MRVVFFTLGCKLNQAESEALMRTLAGQGYQVVAGAGEADILVVNTCTVTATADAKGRHLLRRLHREHPPAWLVVTGCYAGRDPRRLAGMAGVSLVVPQAEKERLPELLREGLGGPRGSEKERPLPLRRRALVKVQDGCSLGCTYCIVPRVRGKGWCRPPGEVVAEVDQRVAEGYQEVVLTGTQVGGYRWNGADLADLLAAVLATGVARLRLTSLQPQDLSPRLLGLWQDPRLCPHFHFPLQSGSDRVLRAMGRRYLAADFRRAVARVREAVPAAAITTDVMVGFPGEEEADFQETLALCRELGLARIHAFPFSPRPGTPAAALAPVKEPLKRARLGRLLALAQESQRHYRAAFLGQALPVLWEQPVGQGTWTGLTANYLRAFTRSGEDLGGRILPARLIGEAGEGLWGELVA